VKTEPTVSDIHRVSGDITQEQDKSVVRQETATEGKMATQTIAASLSSIHPSVLPLLSVPVSCHSQQGLANNMTPSEKTLPHRLHLSYDSRMQLTIVLLLKSQLLRYYVFPRSTFAYYVNIY